MNKNTNDSMSPATSPVSVQNSGTRRVNSTPLILAITALMLFAALIAMVAINRSNNTVSAAQPVKKNIDTSAMVKEVIGDHGVGLIPSKEKTKPVPEVLVDPVTPLNEPMLSQPMDQHTLVDPEQDQIRMTKMQQFQEAVQAKTTIAIAHQLNQESRHVSTESTPRTRGEMIERIAEVRQQIDQETESENSAQRVKKDRLSSTQGTSEDRWKLDQKIQPPRSPFEIRSGNVIPGIMISGINSDLPGQIMGQVSQDVYDTATGQHLLVPQGTRLIGTYASDVSFGQSAIMIAWQRLVFPDGKALDIGEMPGADGAGYTGFRDQVNNHYFRIFASALLLSGVTAGISYSQDRGQNNNSQNNNSQQSNVKGELSQALGQQLGQVTSQMISKNMNIAPTLEIRPGYRFNIIVVKDLDFQKPYQLFDYSENKEHVAQ